MNEYIVARIVAMPEEKRAAIEAINEELLTMMELGAGAAVMLIDTHGVGNADILCCGDAEMAAMLLKSAGRAYKLLYTRPEGALQ